MLGTSVKHHVGLRELGLKTHKPRWGDPSWLWCHQPIWNRKWAQFKELPSFWVGASHFFSFAMQTHTGNPLVSFRTINLRLVLYPWFFFVLWLQSPWLSTYWILWLPNTQTSIMDSPTSDTTDSRCGLFCHPLCNYEYASYEYQAPQAEVPALWDWCGLSSWSMSSLVIVSAGLRALCGTCGLLTSMF